VVAAFPPEEFDWDEHNVRKNWDKHRVTFAECEEMFFNEPLLVGAVERSKIAYREGRFLGYGMTNAKRLLFVVFALRGRRLRVISARDMSRKERNLYHEETKGSH